MGEHGDLLSLAEETLGTVDTHIADCTLALVGGRKEPGPGDWAYGRLQLQGRIAGGSGGTGSPRDLDTRGE